MDLSQLLRSSSGVKFLNLDDACEAEVDILQDMLFANQDDNQLSNLFHLKSFPQACDQDLSVQDATSGDAAGFTEGDGVNENCVMGHDSVPDLHADSSAAPADTHVTMGNGPVVPISPQHHGEMNPSMMPAIPTMRGYYSQPHVPVVHGATQGPVATAGMGQPHGMVNTAYPHVSVAISQVNQQQFLMMQSQAGCAPYVGIPPVHYVPQHRHQHSHNFVQGGPAKYSNGPRKNHSRSNDRNRRPEQDIINNYSQPPQAYYPANIAYPTGLAYFNQHQQQLTTLTGSPIIMSAAPHGKPTSVTMYNFPAHQYSSPNTIPASLTPQPSPSEAPQHAPEGVDMTHQPVVQDVTETGANENFDGSSSQAPVVDCSQMTEMHPQRVDSQKINQTVKQTSDSSKPALEAIAQTISVSAKSTESETQLMAQHGGSPGTAKSVPSATTVDSSAGESPLPSINTNTDGRHISEPIKSTVPDIVQTSVKCSSSTSNEDRLSSPAEGATASPLSPHSQSSKPQTWAEHSGKAPKHVQSTVNSVKNQINGVTGGNVGSSLEEKTLKDKHSQKASDFPALANNTVSVNGNISMNVSSSSIPKERSWASVCKKPNVATVSNTIGGGDGSPTVQVIEQNSNTAISGNGSSVIEKSGISASSGDNNVPTLANSNDKTRQSTAQLSTCGSTHDPSHLSNENDVLAIKLGEFLVNYQLDHHATALTPRGLTNQSNFCYINATLQALMACPPFVNLFRAMKDIGLSKTPSKATPIIQSVFDFIAEFEPLNRGNTNKRDRRSESVTTGSNLEPIGIRKVLDLLDGSTYKIEGRQQDAEEFLSHLLNGLHDEMIKVMKWYENSKTTQVSTMVQKLDSLNGIHTFEGGNDEDDDADHWQVMGPKNKGCFTRKTNISKSPISDMLFGQICSAVHRTNAVKSWTSQPFFTLQLDIQNDSIRSVRDALEGFSHKEEVSGLVSQSGQETEAWRVLSLEELPVILILHLKRFVYDKSGDKIQKLDKRLEFGVDLEIPKDLLSPNIRGKILQKQRQYKLFAVVYHDGEEAYKGHYVADCFHPSGGSVWGSVGWLRYDDVSVKAIPENTMLNSQPPRVPYLLYYRRADTLVSHTQPSRKERPRNFSTVDS